MLTDHSSKMGASRAREAKRGGPGGGSGGDDDDMALSNREERWKRLAVAASKQCLRSYFLDIKPAITLDRLIESRLGRHGEGSSVAALAAHQSGIPLLQALGRSAITSGGEEGGRECLLLVGPEGDFSERELSLLQGLPQVEMVGLGDLRLRVETAALALLSGVRLAEEE